MSQAAEADVLAQAQLVLIEILEQHADALPQLLEGPVFQIDPGEQDTALGRPLEVEVRDSLEKAMKILKQKMSKEGILQEVKRRRFYEKPSVKKKRKMREARKRRRREMKRRTTPK